jgi:thiamine biosynthesis lipoprotein
MGTLFRVVAYTADEARGYGAIRRAFERAHDLDARLSDYKPDSELMRLQRTGFRKPFPASDDLFRVVTAAQQIAVDSEGLFDITIGPLSRLWRECRRAGRLPDPPTLRRARASVGYRRIRLHPATQSIELLTAGMQLDLGGIAKGYAADAMLAILRADGIESALVVAGGDVVVGAPPPGERTWNVGVAPGESHATAALSLRLAHQAVSTSGASSQYATIDGVRYSHILDPRTGLGLTHSTAATVVAPTATESDALATAASVLGARDGLRFLSRLARVEARFFSPDGSDQSTPGFAQLLGSSRSV